MPVENYKAPADDRGAPVENHGVPIEDLEALVEDCRALVAYQIPCCTARGTQILKPVIISIDDFEEEIGKEEEKMDKNMGEKVKRRWLREMKMKVGDEIYSLLYQAGRCSK